MNQVFKYGLLAGTCIGVWNALNYFLLYRSFLGRLSFIVDTAILISFLWIGMKKIKLHNFHNLISFGRASISGVQISLVGGLVLGIITFGFASVPNNRYKNYVESEVKKALDVIKNSAAQAELGDLQKTFVPWNQAKSAAVSTLLIGTATSFIIAMIIRNKLPEEAIYK